ncbi:MAG TPA: hypothetical protein VFK16_04245 [Gemmatimonadaceae bacterium]|jgi:hypothetical protein|nr:hypothetical protein [Gemmatimonadaceae bacterium]
MGCLGRLGCLVLLVLLAGVAWLTRDRWTPYLHRGAPAAGVVIDWQPLTPEGARRAQAALDQLNSTRGPVFQNVEPGDAASYVLTALLGRDPRPADSAAAAVVDHELLVRARVPVRDLGGTEVIGSLASMVRDREWLQIGGTFNVPHPGLTEFRVTEIKVGRLPLPSGLIPRLLQRIAHGVGLDSVASNTLHIPTPRTLADIRVANGHLTLYKGLK